MLDINLGDNSHLVVSATDELFDHVKNRSAHLLSILLIVRKDDGVEWDSQYGFELIKLEAELIEIHQRCYHTMYPKDICSLYVDYSSTCKKYDSSITSIACYVKTTFLVS